MLDVGGGLGEVWWKIIIVNSGLGCVGRWWRFGGVLVEDNYNKQRIGLCWRLRLVEVSWRFGGR